MRKFEDFVPIRLRKLTDAFQNIAVRAFGGVGGLRFTDVRILAYLADRSPRSVMDISRDLDIDKAWISRLLRQLSQRGLVDSRSDLIGMRSSLVTLSEDGRAKYDEMMLAILDIDSVLMNGIDESSVSALLETLESNVRKVLSVLDQREAP